MGAFFFISTKKNKTIKNHTFTLRQNRKATLTIIITQGKICKNPYIYNRKCKDYDGSKKNIKVKITGA